MDGATRTTRHGLPRTTSSQRDRPHPDPATSIVTSGGPQMTSLIGDTTMSALHQALSGLSLRQRTIADNIANIETPGFMAGKVDFETSLKRAFANGDPGAAAVGRARSLEPTRTNGSNVNLDEETLASAQTLLTTQLATAAMTSKFQRLRIAITGQA